MIVVALVIGLVGVCPGVGQGQPTPGNTDPPLADPIPPLPGTTPPLPPPKKPERKKPKRKQSWYVQFATLRAYVGVNPLGTTDQETLADGGLPLASFGFEMVAVTLCWRHFFWEILRGGFSYPFYAYWGTSIGYPFKIGKSGKQEFRLGAHLTMMGGYYPILSGVLLYYQHRVGKRIVIQAGLISLWLIPHFFLGVAF